MNANADIVRRMDAIEADITTLKVDAVVNAANAPLIPGGGVDGAIRRAAGNEINEDLARIGRCDPGTSVLTSGYRLPASYVIRAVAPIWSGIAGDVEEERIFSGCYASALKLADENNILPIAFPAIGTGAYRWPQNRASELAFAAVRDHLRSGGKQTRVIFCCFAPVDRERYSALIARLAER